MLNRKPTLYSPLYLTFSRREDVIRGIPDTPILHAAVEGGHSVIVEAMLNHRAWDNRLMMAEDKYGRCAVHLAAMKGICTIINLFVSRWPHCVDIRSSDYKSVLHFAVEYDQTEVVKMLLDATKRADDRAKKNSGNGEPRS
ncbi:hypothetical protein SUGI_0547260 [Cryptomeria japonica]|nr:hypothetical protein SUGI_0547260 [Cryptomeria japonica]